ncbi:MAG: Zn-ribbon domain-containing OB-fold protein [Planctomycetota bacterium]|jgi:uncharacterized OB-fold protein
MLTTARYWRENAQRYRLEAGKCSGCGKVHFPPRRVCIECRGREFETVTLPDEGKVETFTVIRVAPTAFTDEAPYAVALVELTDGTRLMSQLVDCDPDEIQMGMPVKIEFRRILEDGPSGMLAYGYKCVPKP